MCTHIYIHSYSTLKTMLDFEICKVQPVKTFNSFVSTFYIRMYIASYCMYFLLILCIRVITLIIT